MPFEPEVMARMRVTLVHVAPQYGFRRATKMRGRSGAVVMGALNRRQIQESSTSSLLPHSHTLEHRVPGLPGPGNLFGARRTDGLFQKYLYSRLQSRLKGEPLAQLCNALGFGLLGESRGAQPVHGTNAPYLFFLVPCTYEGHICSTRPWCRHTMEVLVMEHMRPQAVWHC